VLPRRLAVEGRQPGRHYDHGEAGPDPQVGKIIEMSMSGMLSSACAVWPRLLVGVSDCGPSQKVPEKPGLKLDAWIWTRKLPRRRWRNGSGRRRLSSWSQRCCHYLRARKPAGWGTRPHRGTRPRRCSGSRGRSPPHQAGDRPRTGGHAGRARSQHRQRVGIDAGQAILVVPPALTAALLSSVREGRRRLRSSRATRPTGPPRAGRHRAG